MEILSHQITGADNMTLASKNTAMSDTAKGEHTGNRISDINSDKKYKKISRDGDTLEISNNGEEEAMRMKRESTDGKLVISESSKKSDAELRSCSQSQLCQLYSDHKITKQQYEKFMKSFR